MPDSNKRALLIGLTRYRWSDYYAQPLNLGGGTNDVQALAQVLQENFAFAPADMRLLLSEPTTPRTARPAVRTFARGCSG